MSSTHMPQTAYAHYIHASNSMYPHTYASNSICPQHTRLNQHVPSPYTTQQYINIYVSHSRCVGNVTEQYTYAQAGHIYSSYHIDDMVYQTLRNDLAYTVHRFVYLPGHPANASLGKMICHRDRSIAVSTDNERVRQWTGTEGMSPRIGTEGMSPPTGTARTGHWIGTESE